MTELSLWSQAASCYEQAGAHLEAARCYRHARMHRRAADLYAHHGMHRDAAEAYQAAGNIDEAGWTLVHYAGDAAAARAVLASAGTAPGELVRRLVLARCDAAEGADHELIVPVLGDVQEALAGRIGAPDQRLLHWSIAVAEAIQRYDQAALIWSAAVRARFPNADKEWAAWTQDRFGIAIVIPPPSQTADAGAEVQS